MSGSSKILLWDLETGFNVCTAFSLWQDGLPYSAIQSERYIICGSYKWLGQKTVHNISILDDLKRFKKDPLDDEYVVRELEKVLLQADLVIGHNGDKYDMKFFNTRALFHGLDPLPPIPSMDTLKVAKANFYFNSNSLDYIAKFLGVGSKGEHGKDLWHGALQGNVASVKKMIKYCDQDVRILEGIYFKLSPYDKQTRLNPNIDLNYPACVLCGSENLQKRGTARTKTSTYQRYQCQDCGKWCRARTADKVLKEFKPKLT